MHAEENATALRCQAVMRSVRRQLGVIVERIDGQEADKTITEITRRNIIDHFTVANVNWSGRLQDDEFLGRLYPLEELQSTDHRCSTAAGDIRQHRVSFLD